jgi:hypothetical protein
VAYGITVSNCIVLYSKTNKNHNISNIINSSKFAMDEVIETSINNALLAVIAFDVYNDLVYNNYFKTYNNQQKILILILLIIGFMTAIKFLQLLISN